MANIQEVARQAGVSISTVSRVLNGNAKVNGEVRKRVEEAIQALAYQPNPAARSLRTNRSRIIGLLISDIQNPFFMSLIQGVEEEAMRHEYSLILCNSNEDSKREQQYLEVLCSERVAGAIIVPTRERLSEVSLKKFRERDIPIVAVDRRVKNKNIDAVLVDNVRGSREAVAHLIANGYRRIGAITGPLTVTTGHDRLEGYRQALLEAGIVHDPALERYGPFNLETGRQFTQELLQLRPALEALFLGNNQITLGAWDIIHKQNLRVPEDVALVGYDEMQWSAVGSLSLTIVMQPVYELGRTAALRLFHHLQNPGSQTRQEVLLSPTLIIRDSSRPRQVLPLAGAIEG
jgi:DNA-binding LacI/PurR family transcriptional regulator